eukprot:6208269-Pleurochrysis_carterae.AAC.2
MSAHAHMRAYARAQVVLHVRLCTRTYISLAHTRTRFCTCSSIHPLSIHADTYRVKRKRLLVHGLRHTLARDRNHPSELAPTRTFARIRACDYAYACAHAHSRERACTHTCIRSDAHRASMHARTGAYTPTRTLHAEVYKLAHTSVPTLC